MLNRRVVLAGMGGLAASTALAPIRARAADEITIGSIVSATGPGAFLGQDIKDGMGLAVEQINDAGGIGGRKINWIAYDSEGQTQKAIAATKRLLTRDRADIIVGGGAMSGIALAMAPMAEAAKVPFISTEGAISIVEPVAERQYIFKSTVDDSLVMGRLDDYFTKKGITKVAMVADTSGFGQAAVAQMKKFTEENNPSWSVMYEGFNPTDTDMMAQLTRVRDSDAEAILCWTVTPAGVVFLKQAQQLGLDKRTLLHSYGFVAPQYMELAGSAADTLQLISVKFPVGDELPDADPMKPVIASLTDAFIERYDRKPNQFVAQAYDAIQLARLGIEGADGDMAKVKDAIESIKGYAGSGGVFNFSPEKHSGLSKNDLVLVSWADGRFHLSDYA
ncbi:ABC transporter substrate-binding protein [Acuticoccus mangrovi]|uniref:ABC transporter substrate-binding protein n=1 Tax=Acuticoccus mangrovi TaxID=2796142 RepID=A0A934IUY6_9HYPH|nr:ABC transporter substrate-binding protein [Acuticoccus mangrovi]MBJ3778500.1 ABC transporter substrate-binding protein [Acuticoccus mangrovi]